MQPHYLTAFPNFDHKPDLPACFRDVSWHNDACPSWQYGTRSIYVAENDPALREDPNMAQYFVIDEESGDRATLYCGDDKAAAVACVLAQARTLEHGTRLNDEGEQVPALGFNFFGTFIADPTHDETGRFEVDPLTYYALTPAQLAQLKGAA